MIGILKQEEIENRTFTPIIWLNIKDEIVNYESEMHINRAFDVKSLERLSIKMIKDILKADRYEIKEKKGQLRMIVTLFRDIKYPLNQTIDYEVEIDGEHLGDAQAAISITAVQLTKEEIEDHRL